MSSIDQTPESFLSQLSRSVEGSTVLGLHVVAGVYAIMTDPSQCEFAHILALKWCATQLRFGRMPDALVYAEIANILSAQIKATTPVDAILSQKAEQFAGVTSRPWYDTTSLGLTDIDALVLFPYFLQKANGALGAYYLEAAKHLCVHFSTIYR